MKLLLKNIRAINPAQSIDKITNIEVIDGIITQISDNEIQVDNQYQIIEGKDYICSPGLFDMHVHFREPGFEYKEDTNSGTNSAANGGFTGVVVMPNTDPCIDTVAVVDYIKNKSKNALTDVYISAAITKGREGKLLSEMLELSDNGVLMFTDDGSPVSNSEVMRLAFEFATPKDLLLSQHCEDTSLTHNYSMNESELSYRLGLKGYPSIAEEIILSRDIMMAEYLGNRRYHAQHLSTRGSVKLVKDAKNKGLRVSAEVTPHHFVLSDENLVNYDSNFKMNPPLRKEADIEALINGLKDGTIDCIATDHAPHAIHEKYVELENALNGIVGLETSLGLSLTYLVHKDHLSVSELIEKMSVNPRKILNLQTIEFKVGEKANFTIFDLNEEWVVEANNFKSKSKNTPFGNFNLKGKPKFTINNSKIVQCEL
ncbi:MAG TPA: dihydroorotase [Candidatus Kapabacteria bacterium]|nr:dihydroorotase [Candidatus Kapabacteria bacterium]